MAGYLSGGTTGFTSDVSIAGTLFVAGTQTFTGASTFAAITGTTGNFTSALSGHTTLALNGQPAMTLVSASSTTIVATTAVANTSTSTNFTDNAILLGDLIEVGPSALSQGLVLQAVASANSTIAFRYSNVSTANAAQVAINCRYRAWRF